MATSKAKTASRSATSGTSAGAQQSDTEHMDKRGSVDYGMDIGQTEAWTANIKRMYDDYAQFMGRVHGDSLDIKNRLAEIAMTDYAARLGNERVGQQSFIHAVSNSWNNLTDEEKRVMAQETRHHDLAVDRQWNLDEQNQLAVAALREIVTSGNLNTDALVAAIKAVMDGVNKK